MIAEAVGEGLAFLESHVYLLALLGLLVFYGLERAAKVSRGRHNAAGWGTVRVGTFSGYIASRLGSTTPSSLPAP